MAYLKELRVECNKAHCTKQAVVQAWDNRNTPGGLYCRKHGVQILEDLKREVP